MELSELLQAHHQEIVADAVSALAHVRLKHYEADGAAKSEARLQRLVDLVLESLQGRSLVPIVAYAEQVARERYEAGYDFREVHAAFNVLEEAVWKHVVQHAPAEHMAACLGMAGTVLGAGKEALAAEYVTLASRLHVRTLDLSALFEGGDV